ncbi:hypothetical protein AKJ43_03835 [candidate division MSBL1 archaeon SCGC-AAA261D19]|uniref:Radical SAM core domain-containing protein n=1 Tax=candidate division MSBL1 archaeon SCGC-AAA261D19 TaxID=1698273 RepID=A0A133V3D6_9EURY|nr:hypothetical protein AKJ43_03835 [candidate division MSBL1 archaeon SCGC-AAA261D19]
MSVERGTMFRKVAFLTCQVGPHSKVKINLSGCNFDCKYCFAVAKKEVGRTLSVDGLLNLFAESCSSVYGNLVNDVQLTGGEPTEDPGHWDRIRLGWWQSYGEEVV